MLPYLLTNFKIQNYYQNESKFNGVYSRNNLPKIKDASNVINLDEYKSIGTHLMIMIIMIIMLMIVLYLILTALELNIFQKKIGKLIGDKKIFIEYKHMI